MAGLTYRITTLGCRANHAETREIESVLHGRGLRPAGADQAADLEVVHTCTVTHTAAAKSRQAVRRARRRLTDPELEAEAGPRVIVTGCYASSDPGVAADLAGGADRVVPHHDNDAPGTLIDRFSNQIDHWLSLHTPHRSPIRTEPASSSAGSGRGRGILPLPVIAPGEAATGHLRAELKIQDGCDAHCTFCIIPKMRPVLRSKRVADAVEEARRLVDLGHPEIVLTGIFIGAYGQETALRRRQARPGPHALADLLDAVASVPGLQRLRLSSMEPGDVDETLLDAMVANRAVIVPHLHLPLQSGSDAVLRRMNRQYGVGDYLEMIEMVEAALTEPGSLDGALSPLPPAITTDIICGFPGETDADFERTVAVARRVGYLHMHVFPYSARAGTAAARWTSAQCPPAVIQRRVRHLIDLEEDPDAGLSIRYRRRLLGRTVRVLVEQRDRVDTTCVTGRSDHYALVHVCSSRPRGTLLPVQIIEVTPTRTVGRLVESPLSLPVLDTVSGS